MAGPADHCGSEHRRLSRFDDRLLRLCSGVWWRARADCGRVADHSICADVGTASTYRYRRFRHDRIWNGDGRCSAARRANHTCLAINTLLAFVDCRVAVGRNHRPSGKTARPFDVTARLRDTSDVLGLSDAGRHSGRCMATPPASYWRGSGPFLEKAVSLSPGRDA